MPSHYLLVQISAENQEQADTILNALLAKQLVTGGQLVSAPARFLWKGEIVDMEYWTINSYTVEQNKAAIIGEVKRTSVEAVPMISFVSFDGNEDLLRWIDKTLEIKS